MANEIIGVHIFSSGTWNGMKFTPEDLADIARNTNALIVAGPHAPPLKLGHDAEGGMGTDLEGQPALGWIENLRAVGDKLYADFKRIPDTVFEAIKSDLYRQVSIEMRHIEEFGWILSACALLGADLPAVKNLEDLQAYLTAHPPIGQPNAGAGAVQALSFSLAAPQFIGGPVMPDIDKTKEAEAALAERLKQIEERERKSAFTILFGENKAGLEAQVRAGKLTPALRDKIVTAWEKREAKFSVGDRLDIPSDLLGDLVTMSATLPAGETAKGGNGDPAGVLDQNKETPDAEIARKSQVLMAQRPGVTYEFAARQVMLQEPELKRRYLQMTQEEVASLVNLPLTQTTRGREVFNG